MLTKNSGISTFALVVHIFSTFIHILEQGVFCANTRKRSIYSEVFVIRC